MIEDSIQETAKAMSQSLTPVFFISAVAVILGSMTTRYGRVIDRARFILSKLEVARSGHELRGTLLRELKAVYLRAKILRVTVIFTIISIFFVSLAIFCLFSQIILGYKLPRAAEWCFLGAIICLIIALVFFIEDFAISLSQLRIDIKGTLREEEYGTLSLKPANSPDHTSPKGL